MIILQQASLLRKLCYNGSVKLCSASLRVPHMSPRILEDSIQPIKRKGVGPPWRCRWQENNYEELETD